MIRLKSILSTITDFRWMSLAGVFMGFWLFLRQTKTSSFFSVLSSPYLYIISFCVVIGYRLILWILMEKATTYTLPTLIKNIAIDALCFILMMLCSASAAFLLSIFVF